MTTVLELNQGWTARAVDGPVPRDVAGRRVAAAVPGCIHLDLLAAGLIPDPYVGRNEAASGWIGRCGWRYRTAIDWTGNNADRVELVADGLDTVAAVHLNGTLVGRTANMHRGYRFDVRALLRPGRNRLDVTFEAPLPAAERAAARLGPRPGAYPLPYNAIRKMACNFGWDWGPELITCGIWRPIRLESWSGARIAAVRPLAGLRGTTGELDVHVDIDGDAGIPVTVELRDSGSVVARDVRRGIGPVHLEVPRARRWWPAGMGEPALYDLTVVAGDRQDAWRGRIGFRTVSLDTTPDGQGTAFRLSVDGTALFARGVNWIPDDCFPSRVDPGRYRHRLTQAREANANLIRVWGGGIYESGDFYRSCDELGLLVWQDFPFACAAYAEEEPLWSEVAEEARQAVTRLSPHPSLALYCGGNETIWGHQDWGWQDDLGDRSWGLGYYTRLLPDIVRELDPTRPYIPGSPYSFRPGVHPNDPAHGTSHLWDVWNERGYTGYRHHRPRFVAEFGFQGPPAFTTLARAVEPAERRVGSPMLLAHQKAADGMRKLADGLCPHLPEPRNFDDWHWAMSLNQARAISLGVEHFRSLVPSCTGAIVWQLNDCWPVISWSAVDGDGRRKPMWYALRRAFAPRLLTIQPRRDGLSLLAVNDGTDAWHGTVRASHRRLDGAVVGAFDRRIAVEPGLVQEIPLPFRPGEPAWELLLAECGRQRAWWFFAEDVDADYPPADIAAEVTAVADGYRVSVTARSFVRDLALLADRAAPDAEVDDMLVTLLPGQTAAFTVRTAASLDAGRLVAAPVLRSANDLRIR